MVETFFYQGMQHIYTPDALDHMLFLLLLSLQFQKGKIKQLLFLLTAFTLGHLLSLLSLLGCIISLNRDWVEPAIAGTILLTALFNFIKQSVSSVRYGVIFIFGFIHGLGIGNQLQLFLGNANLQWYNTVLPFNLGVELAQIALLFLFLGFQLLLLRIPGFSMHVYKLTLSGCVALISVYWLIVRCVALV